MSPDDVVAQGEAETGALVRVFRGEERFEDLLQVCLGNARPVVLDPDLDLAVLLAARDREFRLVAGVRVLGELLFEGGLAGVRDDVQEYPAEVLGHGLDGAHVVREVLLNRHLETAVHRAHGMEGEGDVLLEHGVDLGRPPFAAFLPRVFQHSVDDGTGPLPVVDDPLEVSREVGADVFDFRDRFFGDVLLDGFQLFLEVLEQFARNIGEVVDEVQRVLDFVRDARGQLTEGGQLLLHHHLVLRLFQVLEGLGQFLVLSLDAGREFLDQVEALHLEGVLPEDFERLRHFPDLVLAPDFDARLQIAASHPAHGA